MNLSLQALQIDNSLNLFCAHARLIVLLINRSPQTDVDSQRQTAACQMCVLLHSHPEYQYVCMIRMQHALWVSEAVYEFISVCVCVCGWDIKLCQMAVVKLMALCLAETIYSLAYTHTQHKYFISPASLQESDVLEVEKSTAHTPRFIVLYWITSHITICSCAGDPPE